LPVALFHVWNIDGAIPNIEAPSSSRKSKVSQAQSKIDKLLVQRRVAYVAQKPNVTAADYAAAKSVKRSRNLLRHYNNVLQLCVALRILGCRTISPAEVKRGSTILSAVFQDWANMGTHLTPYFHFAMHLMETFERFGPAYGWWVNAYERNNGTLGRYNHNGHAGGELEATLMRTWRKSQLVQDLVSHSLSSHNINDVPCVT
jgi:hypothetical protein